MRFEVTSIPDNHQPDNRSADNPGSGNSGSGNPAPSKDEKKLAFIEEVGLVTEGLGVPRMAGRILGALLVADPPDQSADELTETLQASRGSISTMTRFLEHRGLIERVSRPGDRRTYYRNKPNAWFDVTRAEIKAISVLRQLADKGLEIIDSDDPAVRLGLEEMQEFYAFWEREFPAVFAKWERERQERKKS